MATSELSVSIPQLPTPKKRGKTGGIHLLIDGVEHKHCVACGKDKILKEYGKRAPAWDGLYNYCKDCRNGGARLYRSNHVEELRSYDRDYRGAHLDHMRARARAKHARHRDSDNAKCTAYDLVHKDEKTAYNKTYYATNKNRLLVSNRQWCASHPDKVRVLGGRATKKRRMLRLGLPFVWTPADDAFVHQYWHYTCAVCGTERGLHLEIVLDHWIPISSADCPGHVQGNMVPLCHAVKGSTRLIPSCNHSKHNKEPLAWLTEKLGPRQAKAKLKAINAFFVQALLFAERERL